MATDADDQLPGIDLRANGGYIVAAPSLHRSGARYEWIGFEPHRSDPGFFAQVYVDEISGTIAWPNDTDLDPDVLSARRHGDL